MSWAIGYDSNWKRDIGYGVPATCDHPGCGKEIDRGLSHVCGGEPYGGSKGCGLYFCSEHLIVCSNYKCLCIRCAASSKRPFKPTPDIAEWVRHKLTDESWVRWRKENPEEVKKLKAALTHAANINAKKRRKAVTNGQDARCCYDYPV